MSTRSPARYGENMHNRARIFTPKLGTLVKNVYWNHFVVLAEIQRGSDVAERRRLLLVRHPRDDPRPQYHQIEGMCFLSDCTPLFMCTFYFLQWLHRHLYDPFFHFCRQTIQWMQRRTWVITQWFWILRSTSVWQIWRHTWATWVVSSSTLYHTRVSVFQKPC